MYRHIVLFRVRDDVTDPEVSAAVAALRRLEASAGAEEWFVELSLDERKGRVIIEDATFSSPEAYERFVSLPEHRSASKLMSNISDWWTGDYER